MRFVADGETLFGTIIPTKEGFPPSEIHVAWDNGKWGALPEHRGDELVPICGEIAEAARRVVEAARFSNHMDSQGHALGPSGHHAPYSCRLCDALRAFDTRELPDQQREAPETRSLTETEAVHRIRDLLSELSNMPHADFEGHGGLCPTCGLVTRMQRALDEFRDA